MLPQIIAHRGASREAPENTLAAFQRAVDLGADGIELDVHATCDGTIIVHHDAVLRGAGPHANDTARPIAMLTTAQALSYRLADGNAPPTLDGVTKLLNHRAVLYCELKGRGCTKAAVVVLRQYRGPCAVHSFDHRMIADAAALAPEIPRGVLEVSRHVEPAHPLRGVGARDLWQLADLIDADLVRAVHAYGGRVIAWTVNMPEAITRLAAWGVDGLCTDDVALARRVLGA